MRGCSPNVNIPGMEVIMTIQEAIKQRHTVRKYSDQPIPQDIVDLLNTRTAENNRAHNLGITFVTGNSDGIMSLAKILMAKGVNNYFILAGKDAPDLDERLGYCGADLMLYAQTLGLNTWWIGGMVSNRGVKKHLKDPSARVNGIIVAGYGLTQGTQHRSKTADEISRYDGTPPQWFANGVDSLLYAPTALNRQAYRVTGKGNRVSLQCDNGSFAGIDLGIGKYHFESGAGKENFEWDDGQNGGTRQRS